MASHEAAPLVFVHIPKTAGSPLIRILRRQYGSDTGWLRGAHLNFYENPERCLAELEQLRESWPPEIRAVHGHLSFHLREYFPADARFVTVLREPVDRTLSHYAHLVSKGTQWGALSLPNRPPVPEDASIEECLSGGFLPDNLQTRLLSGTEPFEGDCTSETLDAAVENLQAFPHLGVTERFDEFLCVLRAELGWRYLVYRKERVSEQRPQIGDLSAKTLRLVKEHNSFDLTLYERAARLAAGKTAAHKGFVAVESEALHSANERYADGSQDGSPLLPPNTQRPTLRSFVLASRADLLIQEAAAADQREHFEHRVGGLDTNLAALEQSLGGLQRNLERMSSRQRRVLAENERLRDRAEKFRLENEALQASKAELSARNQGYVEVLAQAKSKARDLQNDRREIGKELSAVKRQLKTRERRLESTATKIKSLQDELRESRQLARQHAEREKTTRARVAELEASRAELEASRAELEASRAELQKSHAELEARHAELEGSHAELGTRYADLETDHRKLQAEHRKLQGDHRKLQGDQQKLQGDHRKLRADYSELRSNHAELTASHRELEESHAELNAGYSELIAGHVALEANFETVSERLERLEGRSIVVQTGRLRRRIASIFKGRSD